MNSLSRLTTLSTRAPEELDKKEVKALTADLLKELDELQNLFYAASTHSMLVVLQGMDASGKDGVIRNVLGQMNPQGVQVHSFKVPTEAELAHDFLWRIHQNTPAKGNIMVFNRSHYEDVLVTRVHGWCSDELAEKRFRAINDFERMLMEQNNTIILKFYLHVSYEEQEERLKERMTDPQKRWKYNAKDFTEADLRPKYYEMYEDVFTHCNEVPWHIVPADQNWYKEHYIASVLVKTLKDLHQQYPDIKQ